MSFANPSANASPPIMPTPSRVPWMNVAAFVITACGLAWLVTLPLWLNGGLGNPLTGLLLPAMMITPALATLLVVFVGKTPRTGRVRFLGLWPLRPLRSTLGMSAIAIGGTFAIVIAATFLSAALGFVRLDLANFSGFAETLALALPEGAHVPPTKVLVLVQLLALPLAAVFNGILALGEELGWRGWLLPALAPLGIWPTLLISGVIWGLWHAPLILLGYNFGRTDITGVLFMIGGCVTWGILFGWLRLRTRSVWPAVFAHGALNAIAGLVLLLAAAGHTLDLAVIGPLGIVSWAVIGLTIGILTATGQFRRDRLTLPDPTPGHSTEVAR